MANLFRADKKGSGGIQVDSLTITQLPTKTYYIQNETLDLTGLKVSATAGTLSGDVSNLITTQPASGATMSTLGTNTVIISYGGATTSFDVTVSVLPEWDSRGLDYNSWATIKAYAQIGELGNVASEGDTKTITVSGKTVHMQLASINDGTGTAGTYYPEGTADFVSVELLPSIHVMNSSDTNVGGWNSCSMRTYLNSTIYATLPSDLKNIIVEKTHMRTEGNRSTNLISATDKLWLPTEWECFGANTYSGESASYNKHYSIFSDDNSRIKNRIESTHSSVIWWLSSPYISNNSAFCEVGSSGTPNWHSANNTSDFGSAVALCFRIG